MHKKGDLDTDMIGKIAIAVVFLFVAILIILMAQGRLSGLTEGLKGLLGGFG